MSIKLYNILILLLLCTSLMAVPARPGIYTFTQPDGTSFRVTLTGDEFFKLTRTTDGSAVIKDDDGYYSYAFYDSEGRIHSSGVHVCPQNSSSAAAASARLIPYQAISRLSAPNRVLMSRRSGARLISAAETKAGPVSKKAIVILAQFADLDFKYSRSHFVDMLTKKSYSFGGANGSALDYFNDQFGGKVNFEFTVGNIVTLSHGYAYYGRNDSEGQDEKAYEAVAEACRLSDAQVDFSQFDGDGDGEVDNVFVFVAGKDEAEGAGEDHIWSHQWYLDDGAGSKLTLDGKKINSYAISTELSHDQDTGREMFTAIGTFCHEYSHVLGLVDMYDTDYEDSGGQADALWRSTSIMDAGNYNNNGHTPPNYNAFELQCFGLGHEEKLELGEWTLAPISRERRFGRIDTKNINEYFLVECRDAEGWDKYIGGSGLLIYHIDMSRNDAGYSTAQDRNLTAKDRFYYNEVNCRPDHQCVDLIEANKNATEVSQVFWPSSKINSLIPDARTDFRYWNGEIPAISLTGMRKSGNDVTFTVAGPLAFEKIEAFQDAAIIQWHLASGNGSTESFITISDGSSSNEYKVSPYQTGQYSITLEGLKEKTDYSVKISTLAGGRGTSVTDSFTTKAFYTNGYPFIYLNSANRNSDGSFVRYSVLPLRVYNARNVARIDWMFNSSPVTDDGSGYWTVMYDGILKAVIHYREGGVDIISKKITVKE